MGPVKRVTNVHLKPRMLALERGGTSHRIGPDLNYTLSRIPNHPQALDLASRLEKAIETRPNKHADERMAYSADCYFQRALKFTPSKQRGVVYMLYGLHMQRNGEHQKALELYLESENSGYESIELDYNMGLAYFYTSDYANAKKKAQLAYSEGYPLEGLRNLLKEAGIDITEPAKQ